MTKLLVRSIALSVALVAVVSGSAAYGQEIMATKVARLWQLLAFEIRPDGSWEEVFNPGVRVSGSSVAFDGRGYMYTAGGGYGDPDHRIRVHSPDFDLITELQIASTVIGPLLERMVVRGEQLLVCSGTSTPNLLVVDIADPTDPVHTNTVPVSACRGMTVNAAGDVWATGSNTIWHYELASDGSLLSSEYWWVGGIFNEAGDPRGVVFDDANGRVVYGAAGVPGNAVRIADAADPATDLARIVQPCSALGLDETFYPSHLVIGNFGDLYWNCGLGIVRVASGVWQNLSGRLLPTDFPAEVILGGAIFDGPVMAIQPLLDPGARVDRIADQIGELVDEGTLSGGQGKALTGKLEDALEKLNDGKTKPAVNKLNAFINQVTGMIADGTLTPAEGQPLVDAALAIIEQIENGG